MGTLSETAENAVLDALLGDDHLAAIPNTIYIALFTELPSDSSPGTEVSNSGTAYDRIGMTNNSTNWPAASAGIKRNGVRIDWATPTADWGNVVGFGIMETGTVGADDRIIHGHFIRNTYIASGSTVFALANALILYAD